MKKICLVVAWLFCLIMVMGCEKEQIKETTTKRITESEKKEVRQNISSEVTESANITEKESSELTNAKHNILIAIDPGHQGSDVDMSAEEPIAPGSSETKRKATGGTTGQYTGVPEYQLNLDIALLLKESLENQGYDVLLTRENNETAISNAQRATMANEAGADISIRIHANGSEDPEVNGALVLIGSQSNPYVGDLYGKSLDLGNHVLSCYCEETGMKNLGVQVSDTMTGINWSQIPVIILEMGFMSNENDDRNMQDSDYQKLMITGIVEGINGYYGFDEDVIDGEEEKDRLSELKSILNEIVRTEQEKGNCMSVCVERIDSDIQITVPDNSVKEQTLEQGEMKAASLIKLYIAGTVYENMRLVKEQETYIGETEELISDMICVSDNEAANTLTKRLGDGDTEKGMEMVNTFCKNYGFSDTFMGRLMLDFDSEKENYTSASDCTKFLKKIVCNKLEGAQSILAYLKQQKRVEKIPAGVPQGIVTANKTGELADTENDAAIIYANSGVYIVTILMDNLENTGDARQIIVEVSRQIYDYMESKEISE